MHEVDEKYAVWAIKRYRFATLYLHEDQRYLGRSYIWLHRHVPKHRSTDLHDGELIEIYRIIKPEFERALLALWQPDHFNDAWLGNLLKHHEGHGHMHLIPRYASARQFEGVYFADGRFNAGDEKNCWPCDPYLLTEAVRSKIRDAIIAKIG